MRRRAIITGGGSGIGRAAAILLAQNGFEIGLAGRDSARLAETAAQCRAAAGTDRAWTHVTDVSDPVEVAALFAKARAIWGGMDLLFNNAGSNIATLPLPEQAPQALQAVIASNLTGALLCAREAFALMMAQAPKGGRIINNGSVAAHAPRPMSAAYTAAKHGITGLTKSLILDGAPHGIGCCQIDIGNAATDRTLKMVAGVPQADGRSAPEPRLDVELVARQILHLALLPADALVPFMTIMPLGMPLYGRG